MLAHLFLLKKAQLYFLVFRRVVSNSVRTVRSISNVSFLSMMIERVVHIQLYSYHSIINLLPPHKSGFRRFHTRKQPSSESIMTLSSLLTIDNALGFLSFCNSPPASLARSSTSLYPTFLIVSHVSQHCCALLVPS